MSYFDGNTVTALWNYAQRYALNDNSFASTFGQSTQGAIELISGQTNGVTDQINAAAVLVDGGNGTYTEVDDADPIGDKCSSTSWGQLRYTGNNIGQMLSKHGVSWGWFEAGFDLTKTNPNGTTGCLRSTYSKVTQISPVGLHSAPRAIPVLHPDRKPASHPALVCADHRQRRRRGQSPIRHRRFLRRGEGGQFSRGEFPQGSGLSGRTRRLFQSAR